MLTCIRYYFGVFAGA